MKDYHLHELDDGEFEALVIHLCSKILGTGWLVFRVEKTAGETDILMVRRMNSQRSQSMEREVCIQSKVTSNPVASCSDSEFDNTVLRKKHRELINYESW
jgi:hypothetical protein